MLNASPHVLPGGTFQNVKFLHFNAKLRIFPLFLMAIFVFFGDSKLPAKYPKINGIGIKANMAPNEIRKTSGDIEVNILLVKLVLPSFLAHTIAVVYSIITAITAENNEIAGMAALATPNIPDIFFKALPYALFGTDALVDDLLLRTVMAASHRPVASSPALPPAVPGPSSSDAYAETNWPHSQHHDVFAALHVHQGFPDTARYKRPPETPGAP